MYQTTGTDSTSHYQNTYTYLIVCVYLSPITSQKQTKHFNDNHAQQTSNNRSFKKKNPKNENTDILKRT